MRRCGKYLKSLNLNLWQYRQSLSINSVQHRIRSVIENLDARVCPNLKTVTICHAIVYPESLQSLSANCRQLTSIKFVNCFLYVNVDPDLTDLFVNCSHLTSVDLSENKNLLGECLFFTCGIEKSGYNCMDGDERPTNSGK